MRRSKRWVIQRKSDSTVPFALGQYGGACSVMIPNRSTRTCRARSEVKILPRSWKMIAGLHTVNTIEPMQRLTSSIGPTTYRLPAHRDAHHSALSDERLYGLVLRRRRHLQIGPTAFLSLMAKTATGPGMLASCSQA